MRCVKQCVRFDNAIWAVTRRRCRSFVDTYVDRDVQQALMMRAMPLQPTTSVDPTTAIFMEAREWAKR